MIRNRDWLHLICVCHYCSYNQPNGNSPLSAPSSGGIYKFFKSDAVQPSRERGDQHCKVVQEQDAQHSPNAAHLPPGREDDGLAADTDRPIQAEPAGPRGAPQGHGRPHHRDSQRRDGRGPHHRDAIRGHAGGERLLPFHRERSDGQGRAGAGEPARRTHHRPQQAAVPYGQHHAPAAATLIAHIYKPFISHPLSNYNANMAEDSLQFRLMRYLNEMVPSFTFSTSNPSPRLNGSSNSSSLLSPSYASSHVDLLSHRRSPATVLSMRDQHARRRRRFLRRRFRLI